METNNQKNQLITTLVKLAFVLGIIFLCVWGAYYLFFESETHATEQRIKELEKEIAERDKRIDSMKTVADFARLLNDAKDSIIDEKELIIEAHEKTRPNKLPRVVTVEQLDGFWSEAVETDLQ